MTLVPDYWPLFEAYHRVREPAYRAIIAEAGIPSDALILDAACGDAFYSHLLRDVLGPGVRVLAVDRNLSLLRRHPPFPAAVAACQSDLNRACVARGAFDAVWLCRAMHSAEDPQRRVADLAGLLRPGGRLIVVENDLAHNPILSWPATFEHRVRQALHRALQDRSSDEASLARYFAASHLPEWMRLAGLQKVSVHSWAQEDVAPMPRLLEAYWQMAMDYLGRMIQPFLSADDWRAYRRAFDPDSPGYFLGSDGFYCMELITVACGLAPG